jgi:hypothetical protein
MVLPPAGRHLPGNCPGNRARIGRKLTSSFLFELTDDNKIRQWDGLFEKKVSAVTDFQKFFIRFTIKRFWKFASWELG